KMTFLSRFLSRLSSHSNALPASESLGQRKQTWVRTGVAVCLFLFISGAALQSASAQENTGSITGAVIDGTGAAIKGAAVSAKDIDRGTALNTHTNESGAYDFPRVPVGNYEVTISAQGFQTAIQKKLIIALNQTARVDFQLKVGPTTETVEVSAVAPLMQTDTSLLGNLVDALTTSELPLSTHNTNQLTLVTAPGV